MTNPYSIIEFLSIGPMLLAPLQELPKYGRNPIYMSTLFIYVLFVIASAVASNIETILVARFFAGFFGSPVLATGGQSALIDPPG